jgi:hypothetical protein
MTLAARGASTGIERLSGAAVSVLALLIVLGPTKARAQYALSPSLSDLGLRGDAAASAAQDSESAPASNDQDNDDDDNAANPAGASPTSPSGAESPQTSSSGSESSLTQQSQTNAASGSPPAANYGKPKPPPDPTLNYPGQPKTNYSGQPEAFDNPLPDLQPYESAPMLRLRGGPPDDSDGGSPAANYAILPVDKKKKPPTPDPDPYAQLGVDLGSMRMTPYVETDTGFDSNPQRTTTGAQGSPILRGEVGLGATSLWSSNQLTANLEAGYSDYLKDPDASRPDGAGTVDLRIDATKQTALDFELRGVLSTQQPGSPGLNSTLIGQPLVLTYGGTAGVTETMSRLTLGLHGLIDRYDYQNGELSNGTVDPLSGENYTDYTVQARSAYEITPGLAPFTEVDADTRIHDQMVDPSGFERDSTGIVGQVGTTFEFSQLLTGSASGGYLERDYQDPRLGSLLTPVFNSSLVWTATPLTTLTLKSTTTVNETTVNDASSEVSRNVSLNVSHALLRNLTLTGLASYQVNTYPGADITEHDYLGQFGIQYSLTRWLMLKGTYTHERLLSTNPGSSFVDDMFLLGLRLQP